MCYKDLPNLVRAQALPVIRPRKMQRLYETDLSIDKCLTNVTYLTEPNRKIYAMSKYIEIYKKCISTQD